MQKGTRRCNELEAVWLVAEMLEADSLYVGELYDAEWNVGRVALVVRQIRAL